jgi:hypothetical protein
MNPFLVYLFALVLYGMFDAVWGAASGAAIGAS